MHTFFHHFFDIASYRCWSEDGKNIILLVNTAPIYSKGKVVGTVSCGRDITERKKVEQHIKESLNQKLKNSNKQNKRLCYLIEGTRGGKTRALILRHLCRDIS